MFPAQVTDAWTQAVEDVIGFACAQVSQADPKSNCLDPQEIRQAVEEVLPAAKETFNRMGHFCSASECRCRAETIVQIRSFVEAKILNINSVDAQVYAVSRFNEYLDGRS